MTHLQKLGGIAAFINVIVVIATFIKPNAFRLLSGDAVINVDHNNKI